MSESTLRYEPNRPPGRKSAVLIAIGFVFGIVFWIPVLAQNNEAALMWLLIVPFGEPPVALILAAIPPTRKFGLGVLLAAGVGWLIFGAMCAGVFR